VGITAIGSKCAAHVRPGVRRLCHHGCGFEVSSTSTAGRLKARPDAGAVEETVKLTLEAATQTSATYACSKRKLMLVKSACRTTFFVKR